MMNNEHIMAASEAELDYAQEQQADRLEEEASGVKYQAYDVTLRFQYPAWDEREGLKFFIGEARSKSDAVKQARQIAEYRGHLGGRKGLVWFKAVPADFSWLK